MAGAILQAAYNQYVATYCGSALFELIGMQ